MSTYKPTKAFSKFVTEHSEALLSDDISVAYDAVQINTDLFKVLNDDDKSYWIKHLEQYLNNEAAAHAYASITRTLPSPDTPIDQVNNVWTLVAIAAEHYRKEKYDIAAKYYDKAALTDNLIAKTNVAEMYLLGNGKPKDTVKGINLLAGYTMNGCAYAGYISACHYHQKSDQLDKVLQLYLQFYNTKKYSGSTAVMNNINSLMKVTDEKDKLRLLLDVGSLRSQKRIYDKLEKIDERLTTIEEEIYAPDNIGAKKVQQHFEQIKGSLDEP